MGGIRFIFSEVRSERVQLDLKKEKLDHKRQMLVWNGQELIYFFPI